MILDAHDLACRRGGRTVFRHVGFRLAAGEALVVTGDNGAGKSSLIAVVAGLLAPDAGRVSLEGGGGRPLDELIGLVGHRDGLKAQLTAAENLVFARELLGASARPVAEALASVGMSHAADMAVAILSAGQRRRVALARLLACDRPIWLMDEPGAALDAASLRMLAAMMSNHLAAGGIILAATHQPLGLEGARTLRLERPAGAAEPDDPFLEEDWDGELGWPLDAGPAERHADGSRPRTDDPA
ncbi:heme ABC exporter ATP-binding protein CcmA [Chelatococcus reniformis]|uniref:Cytochrome c biogenesis ATP-binding export protein CcmA n=1 Tax=Chelatococcus reniformis TaxID=1494448 RepID=A0A916TYJ2_9HYPH|nr:heme ABC exporter ATP-binding protein CcmA [Chelatococcus reniformis]GGC51436.1 cytochrome c biogenesis ATP-binding export protein CcmA [Chelatococcus reniformis]